MRPTQRITRMAACLAALLGCTAWTEPSAVQRAATPGTIAIEQRLAKTTGADRIPLLIQLAELTQDVAATSKPYSDEAVALLTAHPSVRLEVRVRIVRSYALQSESNYPAALAEAQQAEHLARGVSDDRLLADAYYQVALVQWRMANYGGALEYAERARALLTPLGDSPALAKTLSHIGAIHYNQGDLDGALEGYLRSLHISETLGDELAVARVHNNIGLVYINLGRAADGYAALMRALAIHERLGPRRNLTNTLNNIGLALIELGRPGEAIPHLERALAIDTEDGDLFGQAKELSNIGYAHERLGQPRRAIDFHQRSLALRERIGDRDGILRSRGALAEVRMGLGDPAGAIPLFEQSIALAAEINSRRDEADLLRLLSKAQAAIGDTAAGLHSFERFHALETELAASATLRRTAELEARYQARQRQADLDAMRVLAESRRGKVRWLVGGSVALGASLVLLGFLYVKRVRAERALIESEQRYRALFQTSMVPFLLVDDTTRTVIDINAPARALCGIDDATNAVEIATLGPSWLTATLAQLFDGSSADRRAVDVCWDDPSGRQHWSEVRGIEVTSGGKACVLVSVRDTTEEHQEEEARQREDKLQSLGVLAGGIAHDFNNALTAILGHVALARDADPAEHDQMLARAEEAATGASHLTAQLLAFAKGGQPRRKTTDICRLLRDAAALAGAGSHMRIDFDLPDTLWHARLDPGQFSQVVSNLVLNAAQATHEGGRLLVRASNHTGALPGGAVPGHAPEGQRFVKIDFEDDGDGIPDAIRHRVFDPYFTTKVGGNGLGLSTAFAICRNHGGALTFTSRPGEGSVFSAFFPGSSTFAVEAPPVPLATPRGQGTILVLDDEPLVRSVLQRMLERWGYTVETVAEGREAVERYAERLRAGSPFDLLVMDLTIPGGMGGRQAIAEILRLDPTARAVVASGYSDDPTIADYREAGFVAALAKPFKSDDLGRIVHEALCMPRDGRPASS